MRNPKSLMLGAMAMLLAIELHDSADSPNGREYKPSKGTKKVIPKGCREYTIRGISVVAISKKSALKKINKIISRNENSRAK